MKCLLKYKWVKIQRSIMPFGRGLMGYWARLASRSAFRQGNGYSCGHINPVTPGMWSGGIVGLKSILGVRRRSQALQIMQELKELGFITFCLDTSTKKLTYEITDWVLKHSGNPCANGAVYATDGYGFFCVPRSITQRLVDNNRTFDEADAWLDLWCHTVYRDYGNAFSFLAPAVQFGTYGSVQTLEKLGQRWGWEKTKVWRFFNRNADTFTLFRLPGSYGCLIFNQQYFNEEDITLPEENTVLRLLKDIRNAFKRTYGLGTDNQRVNRMIAWNSRAVLKRYEEESKRAKNGVASEDPYIRAYFSHGRNCRYSRNCHYDCSGVLIGAGASFDNGYEIRGPCLFISPFINKFM